MKRGLLISFFFALQFTIQAQPYGNEWIDPTRVHYRISVPSDGIYRIPYSTLVSAIPNLNSLNPANLIMYHNGQKVPIYITTSGIFGTNDYIEFYGKHNDGFIDSLLYRSASLQIDPYYSLFEDNSYYYLTTNSLTNNPRYTFVTNNLTNLPAAENYFMYFTRDNYPCGVYFPGKYTYVSGDELYKPIYDVGEGYTYCNYFNNFTGPQSFTLSTPYVYARGPNATFITDYANNSPELHNTSVTFNTTVVETATAEGYQLNTVNVPIPASQLVSGTNTINYSENSSAAATTSQTQNIVGCLGITYPRSYTFDGTDAFYFQVAADPVNTKYLQITNFNDDGTQPLLYDITNGLIYPSVVPAGSSPIKFQLQTSLVNREMFLRANDGSTFSTVTQLSPLNFVDYTNTTNQGQYYIIASDALFNDGSGNNWVEAYRKYRDINENPGVGKYLNARIADADLLYDQFGYGIRKSPMAIRNFINYATAKGNWSIPLKEVFLVGKGRLSSDIRSGSGPDYDQCLVPTFGYPASDNLLAASRTSDSMAVAIGRLPAQTGQQVEAYYNKMKAYELAQNTYAYNQDIPDKLWQKQILHFTGGTGQTEQQQFEGYAYGYQLIAQDTSYGANITSYAKTTDQPIDQSQSQVITNDINNGVSWITFFGHSSTGAFDFSIDVPENYTNYNKFPIILSNGCYSGDIDEATPGYSERFVLEANIGAIAFMATSSLAVSSGLNDLSDSLYQDFCRRTYYQPLGVSMQRTLNKIYNGPLAAIDYDLLAAYEMTLDGDPGLFVNQYPKPDYAIDASSVFFTPSVVTAGMDSFTVSVVITNLGKAVKDSMSVTLTRNIFDNSGNAVPPFIYTKNVMAPYYIDTVNFKLPVNISNLGYGQNLFSPYVDAGNKIDEMTFGNNGLTTPVSINISSDDIIPIYPYNFAIVPQQGVTLKASTVNPFASTRYYKFQLDTTQLFTSPLVQNFRISQSGGVVHWKPTITYKDSVVYYWRVAKDSVGATWHNSSFIYLANEYPGWNQSHYFQWQQDNFLNLSLQNNRTFAFPPTVNNISVITGRADAVGGNVDYETLGWDLNNYDEYAYRMGGCGYYNGGLTFAVIDTLTGQPWGSYNLNGDNYGDAYGNVHCSYQYSPQYGFDFPTAGTNGLYNLPWSQVIKNFINAIPAGDYVLVYSVNGYTPYTTWDTTLVHALQSIGLQAQLFQNGTINGPFVYFTQKQNVNYTPFFAYNNSNFNVPLDTNFNFIGRWYQGNMTSTLIGPAAIWGSVHWKGNANNVTQDTLDIIGETAAGLDSILLSTTQTDIFINRISAVKYPYLKLRLRTIDDSLRTPVQLKYWRVLFKKPPDAAINPAAHFVISDSVNIGSKLHVEVAIENVTDVPMDSLLTKYTVRDASFHLNYYYQRYGPLPAFDTMIMVFNEPITTASYAGLDDLIIEANPNNDQVEEYHFNNIAEIGFHGYGDNSNPLLDVTFDNQHIMNNDIVSAKPDIMITLKSANQYLALNDTSEIGVYLVYPNQTTPVRFNYDGVTMKFYPADSNNLTHGNKAQVEFKPTLAQDGTYELIVRDMDRSGNNSSTTNDREQSNLFYDYKIDFQVINKPMITNVLNYPNPFTTSTRFVFTITGSEVPDFMTIQIMTIKGVVVKEITEQEMGPLHIGTNMTEYAWDGRDQYGDPVANGVYFYKVVTRLDNKQMDAMAESYDSYFKHGIGKLVIIR